jgi:hypothetical protein
VQDSPNLDTVLRMVISTAFAQKLETLSLATVVADANIPASSVAQDPAEWA